MPRFTEHSPDRMRSLLYRSAIELCGNIHKLLAHSPIYTQQTHTQHLRCTIVLAINYDKMQLRAPFVPKNSRNNLTNLFYIILTEIWTFRAADQKYLESFEMRCWRRMEKISWTDHVRNEEVLICGNKMPTRCNGGFYCI